MTDESRSRTLVTARCQVWGPGSALLPSGWGWPGFGASRGSSPGIDHRAPFYHWREPMQRGSARPPPSDEARGPMRPLAEVAAYLEKHGASRAALLSGPLSGAALQLAADETSVVSAKRSTATRGDESAAIKLVVRPDRQPLSQQRFFPQLAQQFRGRASVFQSRCEARRPFSLSSLSLSSCLPEPPD